MNSGNCESGGLRKAELGTQTLAERLEKSEAGRKKLRQAISILQEKLASAEKLLKANDNLQKECEQERQRAESEKKKAEEEKRLRVILERDSASVKDQLAKVFQRLGAVENKQKTDKKQVERLQKEVKVSVEGLGVAAQAVDAVQSSLQNLETKLLEKVDAAFREAHTASEAVHQLQTSFQSLQSSIITTGSLPDTQLLLSEKNQVSEKLVEEISHLFRKEKKSHYKIEQRLSKLRVVLKQYTRDNPLTSAEDSDPKELALSKMEEGKVLKKRKPGGKEELLNWKARKRSKISDVDVVNSFATRRSVDAAKEAYDSRSMSSPFSMECQMTLLEPPCVLNTASDEYIGEAIVNHRGSSNGTAHMQILPVGGEAQKESQERSYSQRENADSGPDVIQGCLKNTCLQDGGISEIQSGSFTQVMQHGTLDQSAGERGIRGRGLNAGTSNADVSLCVDDASDSDLNFDDSDDEWWSQRVLLSPSLPDIPSPVHHSPSCSREPSLSKTDAHVSDTTLDLDSSAILDVPVRHSHVLTEAATSKTNTQGVSKQCGGDPVTVCPRQLEVSSQKGITLPSSSLQPGSRSGVMEQENKSGTSLQLVHVHHSEVGSEDVLQSAQHGSLADKQGTGREFQFDDEFGFEAVDSAAIAEFDNFLEVFPPIPSTLSNSPCAFELPKANHADAQPCEVIGLSNEIYTSDQPQAASEMPTLKAVNIQDSKACDHNGGESCDGLIQVINLSQITSAQDLPIQDQCHTFKDTKETHSILESSYSSDPPALSSSSTKPSSSIVIFLLQAFDLKGPDAELNVIAACIMAINFKEYLKATIAEKEKMQLQGATLATTGSVPTEYLACSFSSAVVDSFRLGNREEGCNSEAKPLLLLVQELVLFIRSMFKEKANSILDTTVAQLGRFLVQGEAMLMTLQGWLSPYQDVVSSARVLQNQKHHLHHYREATLEDIDAGGKVLAALCQVLSCVTHLQNVVYEVLGWCGKDVIWLLTVFSSFSSICGNSAFIAGTDDILGHAICAIILELVASVEQESIKTAEVSNSNSTTDLANVGPSFALGWSSLNRISETNGNMGVEQVVLAIIEVFRYIFSSGHDTSAASVEHKPLQTKECHDNETKRWQILDFSEHKSKDALVSCQEASSTGETRSKGLSERQGNTARRQHFTKWQKKHEDAVAALQLIVLFMGWEWAYNHLVIRCLWRKAVPGYAQLGVAVVAHILSILWRIGVQGGGPNLLGLEDLKNCLVHIAQSASISLEKFEHQLSAEEWVSDAR